MCLGEWGRKHFSSNQSVINYGNIKSVNTNNLHWNQTLLEQKAERNKIHRPLLTHLWNKWCIERGENKKEEIQRSLIEVIGLKTYGMFINAKLLFLPSTAAKWTSLVDDVGLVLSQVPHYQSILSVHFFFFFLVIIGVAVKKVIFIWMFLLIPSSSKLLSFKLLLRELDRKFSSPYKEEIRKSSLSLLNYT